MEDPNLIFILKPIGERATRAFGLEHNEGRYVRADLEQIAACRGITPSTNAGDSDGEDEGKGGETVEEDLSSNLHFKFNQKPKDIKRGFVFGGSSSKCDVVLGHPDHGISARAFRNTFDDLGRLILEAKSTARMAVSYDGQAAEQWRHNFKWILFPGFHLQAKTDGIKRRGRPKLPPLEFSIHIAWHNSCKGEYEGLVRSYIEEARSATEEYQRGAGTLDLHLLDMSSLPSTAAGTEPHSPGEGWGEDAIYIRGKRIGSGLSGTVYQGLDVSTGNTYAIKDLRVEDPHLKWRREVEIMKNVSHEHLVKFKAFTEEVVPSLIMEYAAGGCLAEQHEPLTEYEVVTMADHILRALEHLHSQNLVHRDVKPPNILVQSRSPPHFMLCDFGLANHTPDLRTFCGTASYVAPEVRKGSSYTPAVDIWSLGIVVYEYVYGLPKVHPRNRKTWYEELIGEVRDWDSDDLIDLLSSAMLRYNAEERLSASDCLRAVTRLRQNAPRPTLEMKAAKPTEALSSSVMMRAMQNAGYPIYTSGHISGADNTRATTMIWRPEDEAQMSKSSIRYHTRVEASNSDENTASVSQEDGHMSVKRRRTISHSNPLDPVDPFSDKPDREPSSEQRGPSRVHYYWIKADFSPLTFSGKTVFFRKVDSWINASQIVRVAGYGRGRHPFVWKSQKFEYETVIGAANCQGIYVPIEVSVEICKRYGLPEWATFLEDKFQPTTGNVTIKTMSSQTEGFVFIEYNDSTVAVRRSDGKVNMTHVCYVAGLNSQTISDWKRRYGLTVDVVRGRKITGSYADFSTAIELGQSLKLPLIVETLYRLKSTFTQKRKSENALDNVGLLPKERTAATPVNGRLSQSHLSDDRVDNDTVDKSSRMANRIMSEAGLKGDDPVGINPNNNGGASDMASSDRVGCSQGSLVLQAGSEISQHSNQPYLESDLDNNDTQSLRMPSTTRYSQEEVASRSNEQSLAYGRRNMSTPAVESTSKRNSPQRITTATSLAISPSDWSLSSRSFPLTYPSEPSLY